MRCAINVATARCRWIWGRWKAQRFSVRGTVAATTSAPAGASTTTDGCRYCRCGWTKGVFSSRSMSPEVGPDVRVVVAGFGNELRGDDGFGIAVLRRLEAEPSREGVTCVEVGTAGLRLTQELLTPCDRLIVVDAMARGGSPGTVYVLKVEDVPAAAAVDLHLAVPSRALSLAK